MSEQEKKPTPLRAWVAARDIAAICWEELETLPEAEQERRVAALEVSVQRFLARKSAAPEPQTAPETERLGCVKEFQSMGGGLQVCKRHGQVWPCDKARIATLEKALREVDAAAEHACMNECRDVRTMPGHELDCVHARQSIRARAALSGERPAPKEGED